MNKTLCIAISICIGILQFSNAQEKLEVQGAIVIGQHESTTPKEGTIRFNKFKDFEGMTDAGWQSLTKSGSGITGSNTIVDVDGNVYRTVRIGTQIWMRSNLRTSRLRDATIINEQVMNIDWDNAGNNAEPAFSWMDADPRYDQIYGKLYNWHTVNTAQLCPAGWHVPSKSDWEDLLAYFPASAPGNYLRTDGDLSLWSPGAGNNAQSGLNLEPGGERRTGKAFGDGLTAHLWTSTKHEINSGEAYKILVQHNTNTVDLSGASSKFGYSIRCIKN